MLSENLIKKIPALKNHKWKNVGTRKSNSVLNRDLYIESFSKQMIKEITGINHGSNNLLFVDSTIYIDEEEFKEFSDEVIKRSLENPEYYAELTNKFKQVCEEIESFSRKLMSTKLDSSNLKEQFKEAIDNLIALISFSYLNHNEEEVANRLISKILDNKNIPKETLAEVRAEMINPSEKKTLLQQEQDDLKKINKEDIKGIKKHIEKYAWVNSNYFNVKEVTTEETLERIKQLSKSDPKQVSKNKQNIELNQNEKIIVEAIQDQMFYKTLRKELISLFSYAVRDLFKTIADNQKLDYEEFINQTVEEINGFFETGKTNKKEIEKRIDGFDFLFVDGKKYILPKETSNIIAEKKEAKDILKGTSAHPGMITSKVYVIKTDENLKNINSGEIVVIDTVSPDIIKYFSNVKGIITNSGGILSHAALIAREKNIPCIVGTRIATQDLNTGDFVTLDANNGIVKKIPKKKFRKMFSITMGLCRADLYMPTHVFNIADVIGKGHNEIVFTIKDGKNTGYFSEEVIKDIGDYGLNVLRSKNFVDNNILEVEKECQELWNYSEYLKALPLKNIPIDELLSHYNDLFKRIQRMFGYFNVSQPGISFALENEIGKQMDNAGLDADTKYNILNVMLKADKTTLIEEEEKDLIKIAIKLKIRSANIIDKSIKVILSEMDRDVYNDLIIHHNNYSFLASSENFDEFYLDYFIGRLKDLTKKSEDELKEEIKQKSPNVKKLVSSREDIISKYKLSSELIHLLNTARIYSHQRMNIRIYWTNAVNVWGRFLREFARRMDISEVKIQYLTRDKINRIFKDGDTIDHDEIKKMMDLSVFAIFDKSEPFLLTGKEAIDFEKVYLTEEIENKMVIKGTIASRGVKKGKVKLLSYGKNMAKQIEEMEQGDILVTGNTRPDMIMALKKASAVVTDEGGIMSHAALVAREFGVPCIVGTKNATTIFKDGDIIEVDANNGVVRKLDSI